MAGRSGAKKICLNLATLIDINEYRSFHLLHAIQSPYLLRLYISKFQRPPLIKFHFVGGDRLHIVRYSTCVRNPIVS